MHKKKGMNLDGLNCNSVLYLNFMAILSALDSPLIFLCNREDSNRIPNVVGARAVPKMTYN